jgi:hypothetical protein
MLRASYEIAPDVGMSSSMILTITSATNVETSLAFRSGMC